MKYTNIVLNQLLQGNTEIKYNNVNADKKIKSILEDIGLPSSVAPYIDFFSVENGGGKCLLDSINMEIYKDDFSKVEFKEIISDFKKYIKLAHTNNGDIIAIDYNNEIVCINHESLDEIYVNLDLESFLLCIYTYFKFMQNIKDKFEKNIFIEDVIELNDIEELKMSLLNVDSTSLNDESFWSNEIEQLIEEANER